MGVSGVGSSYTCMYNLQTGKISSKDGSSDEFVSYYNGDITAEETTELNGYDRRRKGGIETLLRYCQDVSRSGDAENAFDPSKGNEFEITCKTVDAITEEYYVNGERVLTEYIGLRYSPEEISQFTQIGNSPFKTHQHKAYDSLTNSINIAVGDSFNLGNGYRITVLEDGVQGEGFGHGSRDDDEKLNRMIGQLTALIHFADQQCPADAIYTGYGDSSMIIAFLQELGVDTSREFTINRTRCIIKNGNIREAGSRDGIPSTIFNKALKRYEEWLYQPLSSGQSYR